MDYEKYEMRDREKRNALRDNQNQERPRFGCDLYKQGVCQECQEYPRFGCEDLRRAYEAGVKYGAERFAAFAKIRGMEIEANGTDYYVFYNPETATEDDCRRAILCFPFITDRRILFVEKNTWDGLFGACHTEEINSPDSDDPYSWVKIAEHVLYWATEQDEFRPGVITSVVRPENTKDGKGEITISFGDSGVRLPFAAVGKQIIQEQRKEQSGQ